MLTTLNIMKKILIILTICICAISINFNGYAEESAKNQVNPKSIYARIGGQPAMDAAVDLFY